MSALQTTLEVVGLVVIGYAAAVNLIYLAFTAIAWRGLVGHLHAQGYAADDEVQASPLTPPVSVLLPAFDEEAGVVESVRSLLALRYPEHEVIVINDGSRDATLERLDAAFDLVPVRLALRGRVATAPVRGAYASRRAPSLLVIDKENGGKADALNCGIGAARHPYVCAVDADAILEETALLRVARPVVDDPETVVATGGIVRIANGCRVDHGRVVEVGLPRRAVPTFQVVEYFRAFLVGRMGWSRLRALFIISGAFGLFRRDLVEEVGGWSTTTVGEDVELVVRLHRHLSARGAPYRVAFVPDPVCWTECPESLRVLARQRRRWHRGLAQALWRHRGMIGNPRNGRPGLLAAPYFLLFELLGPIVEALGYILLPVAVALGLLSVEYLLAFLLVSVLLGALLSVSALALEELSFRRHARGRDAARLMLFAALEPLGYMQLTSASRLLGLWDALRGKRGWGAMQRRGFATATPAPESETPAGSGSARS